MFSALILTFSVTCLRTRAWLFQFLLLKVLLFLQLYRAPEGVRELGRGECCESRNHSCRWRYFGDASMESSASCGRGDATSGCGFYIRCVEVDIGRIQGL